jgi:predicted O-linked N-acetylglucosamine transferase (SPINDLY family)
VNKIQNKFSHALRLHQAGNLREAELAYRQVLRLAPAHAGANEYLGVIRIQQGDLARAIELLRRAVALDPASHSSNANLGNALRMAGDRESALTCFSKAIALAPQDTALLAARGNLLLELDSADAALVDFRRGLELQPDNFLHEINVGNALMALGQPEAALVHFDRAVTVAPNEAIAHSNRGHALLALRQPHSALESCREAVARDPNNLDALYNCGCACLDLRNAAQARTYFERVLARSRGYVKAAFNLGIALRLVGDYESAAVQFQRVLDLSPSHPYTLGAWLRSLQSACSWREIESLEARLLEALTRGEQAADAAEVVCVYDSPQVLHAVACREIRALPAAPPLSRPWSASTPGAKLKVAYLSADFHEHATAHLIAGLIEQHDRSRFEILAISYGPNDRTPMRARLEKAFDQFVDASSLSDHAIADMMRRAGVQIAVDLKGLTQGGRLGILAQRCAPVQVTYLGHPSTTGANYVDYLIADRVVIPEEHQPWYTERIVYLPDSYQVNDPRREISNSILGRADVGLPDGVLVYCCFNASYKISPVQFSSWMRVLHRVPGSVLWLLHDNDAAVRNLRAEATRNGIDSERLVFAPRVPAAQHIARYRLADLFLDTLPVGAHTTASEALWAGLPVLTCLGQSFAGRVGASLLAAAGLPELITTQLTEYESLAVELAEKPESLRALRLRLASGRDVCALFDLNRFRLHIEQAYEMMWQRYERGEPAAHFSVSGGEITGTYTDANSVSHGFVLTSE